MNKPSATWIGKLLAYQPKIPLDDTQRALLREIARCKDKNLPEPTISRMANQMMVPREKVESTLSQLMQRNIIGLNLHPPYGYKLYLDESDLNWKRRVRKYLNEPARDLPMPQQLILKTLAHWTDNKVERMSPEKLAVVNSCPLETIERELGQLIEKGIVSLDAGRQAYQLHLNSTPSGDRR